MLVGAQTARETPQGRPGVGMAECERVLHEGWPASSRLASSRRGLGAASRNHLRRAARAQVLAHPHEKPLTSRPGLLQQTCSILYLMDRPPCTNVISQLAPLIKAVGPWPLLVHSVGPWGSRSAMERAVRAESFTSESCHMVDSCGLLRLRCSPPPWRVLQGLPGNGRATCDRLCKCRE